MTLAAVFLVVTIACAFLGTDPTRRSPVPTTVVLFPTRSANPSPSPAEETPTYPETATSHPADVSFLGLPWNDGTLYADGLAESQRDRAKPGNATEYHIELSITEDLLNISGHEEVHYTNNETDALDRVEFHLLANLIGARVKVSNVTVNGKPVKEKYDQYMNSLLIVPLAQPLSPGQSVVIGMDFSLEISENPQVSYGVLASIDGVLTLAHAYPMVAVYGNKWDETIPATYGDLTYADASFYTVRVRASRHVTLIASGRQVSLESGAISQTALFALGPGRDFMLTAARNYELQTEPVGGVTVNSYAPASADVGYSHTALETAREALRIYSERYAPYPYTEFDIVATPTYALGVEYPGLVAISAKLYAPDAPDYYLESTVAHEAGHQWFYNLVGNDQLHEPWLDESLTQFITWQYYADRYGESGAEGFKESLTGRWQSVKNAPIPVGKPVEAYSQEEYGSIVYGRGALFFFALRDEIGQEAFDVFLKTYATKYSWGLASTEDLKTSAEQTCGCNLTPLFNDWIYPSP
jgi:hypothetical protein